MKKLLVMLLLTSGLLAQDRLIPRKQFMLNSHLNRFRLNDTTAYIEVSLEVYPGLLTLTPSAKGFSGAADIALSVRDKKTGVLAAVDRISMHVSIPDTSTQHRRGSQISKVAFALPAGSYRLDIVGVDSLAADRRDSITVPFTLDKAPAKTYLSDMELCSSIQTSGDKDDPFYKNSYSVRDNPSMVFGRTTSPVVFVYTELYNLISGNQYLLTVRLLDATGKLVSAQNRRKGYDANAAVDVTSLNVIKYPSGKYRLVYSLADTAGNAVTENEAQLYVFNPDVKQPVLSSAASRIAEFGGMNDGELNEEFAQMKYLLRRDDIQLYAKADSTTMKRQLIATFWTEIESGSRGWTDLTRVVYHQRMVVANDRYHASQKAGWKTDRGRVYLLYGDPDEIERFPSAGSQKPYEAWHYDKIENSVMFVFIDLRGFGDYVLVHSTKRGEIQDEGWQQYLQ